MKKNKKETKTPLGGWQLITKIYKHEADIFSSIGGMDKDIECWWEPCGISGRICAFKKINHGFKD